MAWATSPKPHIDRGTREGQGPMWLSGGAPPGHVKEYRIATILRRRPWRPVACPPPYEPYTFLKALFETRSESLSTRPGGQDTSVQVRSRTELPCELPASSRAATRASSHPSSRRCRRPTDLRYPGKCALRRVQRPHIRPRRRARAREPGRAVHMEVVPHLEHGQSILRVASGLLSAARP